MSVTLSTPSDFSLIPLPGRAELSEVTTYITLSTRNRGAPALPATLGRLTPTLRLTLGSGRRGRLLRSACSAINGLLKQLLGEISAG